jgi:hypothetical protein
MDEKYSWMATYRAAMLETDNEAMSLRIYEALAAIEQRRLSYLEIDGWENQALEDAERGRTKGTATRPIWDVIEAV